MFPATTWESVHLWFQQLPETLYFSGRIKYMRKFSSLVPVSTWDKVFLWSQQILDTRYTSVSSKQFVAQYISDSSNYLRHCKYLLPATNRDKYSFVPRKKLRHYMSLVTATTGKTVHFWFQRLNETIHIFVRNNYEISFTFLVPASTWNTIYFWFHQLPETVQLWTKQLIEAMYMSVPSNNFKQST